MTAKKAAGASIPLLRVYLHQTFLAVEEAIHPATARTECSSFIPRLAAPPPTHTHTP